MRAEAGVRWEPRLWDWLIDVQKVESFIDVGCGAGVVTKYFLDKGVDARCVEASNEAINQSFVPSKPAPQRTAPYLGHALQNLASLGFQVPSWFGDVGARYLAEPWSVGETLPRWSIPCHE